MNKFKLCLILGVICLLAVSVSATDRKTTKNNRNSLGANDNIDEDLQAVCTSADRKARCSSTFLSEGCLCYNNGTCINTRLDRCKACLDETVFSAMTGTRCPRTQAYLCQPPIAGVKYSCLQQTYDSCVCSLNGTCAEQKASHCMDCQNPNILAVFENKTCVSKFLQTPPSKYFIPKKCDKTDSRSISCLKTQTPGCTCYSNGTCEYRTDSNRCLLCFDKNIVSFNQGEYCPSTNNKIYVCDSNSDDDCSSRASKSSCVCDSEGMCNEKQTNRCKACKSKGTVSVVEGGRCPMAKYVGLSSAKANFKPESNSKTNTRRNTRN